MATRGTRDEHGPPWERQPGEPSQAHAGFQLYLDLGRFRRSLERVSAKIHPPRTGPKEAPPKRSWASGKVKQWSREWNWADRAKAWDDHCDRESLIAQLDEICAMRKRHAEAAMALERRALEALEQMDIATLKPIDITRFLAEAVEIERVARGVADASWLEQELLERSREADEERFPKIDPNDREASEAARAASRDFIVRLAEIRKGSADGQ